MNTRSWFGRGWQWKVGGCVALVGALSAGASKGGLAQIVPDKTLGAERSIVKPNIKVKGIPSDRIEGGATRGANLFHSFQDFNVKEGRGAYFANPTGIENILSRVTGANRSEILGRLGVLGNANLFLVNPNGIVFGENASLDVQGSFLATTADAVKLGDAGLFSASQPAASNLLTISPSALWFNAVAAQPIVNQSQAPSLIDQPNSVGLSPGLQVQLGRTLALVGGDVRLEGGRLTAAGGRIELGSVAGVGQVSLTQSENRLALGYNAINGFGNIRLSDEAFVDASGEGGGDIQVRGARLEMTQRSDIWANTLGVENGGEVLVDATEVDLSDGSLLTADVTGTGAGGDLTINTGRLLVRGGARVSASTFSTGAGGNLKVTADAVELSGTSADNSPSRLSTDSDGIGDAGDLTIDTGRLLVRGGAQVSASTFSEGKGGSLQIRATDAVELSGISANSEFPSALFAQSDGIGDAGDLTIDTGRLLVSGEAQVSAGTTGKGQGGSLQITAADSVELIGSSADGQFGSGLFTVSRESGDAGDLTINTGRLLVSGGAQVSAGTTKGQGGSLQITAPDAVELMGESADGQFPSTLSTQSEGTGDAGDLTINTGRLLVSGGAQVSAGTTKGQGGNLQVTAADSVELIGSSADGQFGSGLFTVSRESGDAGDLTIVTGRLLVQDGAQVGAGTFGKGQGGSLQIIAADAVELSGSSADGQFPSTLSTASQGTGDAGDVLGIDTGRLLVRDEAEVSSASFGEGIAGDIDIMARDTLEAENGTIRADTSRSAGGAITIAAGDIRLSGDSDIRTDVASGAGGGGDIKLTADSIVAFNDSDMLAFASKGRGGNIRLKTQLLLPFIGENYRPGPSNTLDNNNRVDIDATGDIVFFTPVIPDVTFIQELPETQINTDTLLANSCIVRRDQPTRGSFIVTGSGGLPQRPGEAQMSSFPTVDVTTLPSDKTSLKPNPNRPWQKGDPIVEPQGMYRLSNGKPVMSRECS